MQQTANEFYEVRLAGMEVLAISIAPKPKDFIGKIFNFDMNVDGKADAPKSTLILSVKINVRDGDSTEHLGHINVGYAFEIKDFENQIKLNDQGIYIIPQDLEFQLRTIALSTTRGVMHFAFKGTYLNGATLPIIGSLPIFSDNEVKKIE